MRETSEKPKRSPNYTHLEKSLLLEITAEFRQIIENKKTDSKSVKEKDTAWDRITQIFNFRTRESNRRSNKSLRKLHDNLKNNKRRIKSQEGHSEEELALEVEDEECKDMILGIINQPVYGSNKQQNGYSQTSHDNRFFPESPSSHSHDEDVQDDIEHSYYALRQNQMESEDKKMQNDYHYHRSKSPQRSIMLSEDYSNLTKIKMALCEQEKESMERRIKREEELHELKKRKLLLEIKKIELEIKKFEET